MNNEISAFIGGVLVGGLIAFLITWRATVGYYHSKAIEHGAAQYDPQHGSFEWKPVTQRAGR